MEQNKEYFVFISYSSLDNEWAIWLRHELEHYHLPASFNGRTDVRDNLRKVFRDRDELSAGPEWDAQVQKALEETNNLIVICSPHSAKSEAVNKEVETFIALGKEDHIFPFIVEGDKPEDCFPPALRHSKLGGDVNKDGGRDSAFIKVVAGMLKVSFPSLWNRYEIEKAEEERKIREQRDKLLRLQSRYIADKVDILLEEGDSYTANLFALEALPKDLNNPDRPYVPEAEYALRKSVNSRNAILKGHTDKVYSVAFSPDGKYIASASWDHTVKIWEVSSGTIVNTFTTDYDCNYTWVSFSPDGKYVYARTIIENYSKCWNRKTEEELDEIRYENSCHLPNGELISIDSSGKEYDESLKNKGEKAVTFDGKLLANLVNEKVLVWDTTENALLYSIGEKTICFAFNYQGDMLITCGMFEMSLWNLKNGLAVANSHLDFFPLYTTFSPDGNYVLIASADSVVYLFSIPELSLVKSFEGHTGRCLCANFSPNGQMIVSSSEDSNIRLWDLKKYEPDNMICVNERYVSLLVYAPDGKHVLSKGNNQDLCMWNVQSGELVHTYNGLSLVNSYAAFSPNGKWLLGCDGEKMIMWDVQTEQIINQYKSNNSKKVSFSQDGKQILMVGFSSFSVLDVDSWTVVKTKVRNNEITAASILPDAQRVAVAVENRLEIWKDYDDVHRDVNDYNYWLSPNNKRIAWIVDNDIRYWLEHKTVYLHEELMGHNDRINSISYSPDGIYVASASYDATIKLWDVHKMEAVKTYEGHTNKILSVEFSNDGRLILSASEDRTVRVWDVESGVELFRILVEEDKDDELYKASFSPDNKSIATISTPIGSDCSIIKIWTYPSLQELINETRECFKNRPLTPEELKKYNLD